jgi:uncharacterized protein
MLTQKKIAHILKKEMPYLNAAFGIKKLSLFGSFAKGTPHKLSDIDIIVEFNRPIGLKFIDLADYLEKILGRKIDILTTQGLKGIRVKRIADTITKGLYNV